MVTLWSQATTMPREHSSPLPRRSGYRRRRSRTPQRERLTSRPSSRRPVEGALSSLLEDLPDPMIEAIHGLGVETCVDFSHMWSSTRECVAELARLLGCDGFDEGIVKKLNRKLKAAQSEAQFQMEDAIKQVVQERRSSVATSPARSSSSHPVKAPPVPPPSNRIRPLQVAGGGDVGVRVVSCPLPLDPHTKEEVARQKKLDAIFEVALQYVLNLAELGITSEMLQDPLQWRSLRDTTMAGAARLSVNRLGALLSAFKRWLKYCKDGETSPMEPSPLQLSQFLKLVAYGGPTASASMHAALKWWCVSLGAAFPIDHWMVRPFRFNSSAHAGRQAPELEPWEFTNILLLLQRLTGTHKLLAAMVLLTAVSCIRYEHVQRSTFVAFHDSWVELVCSQGKARKKGARPPFHWCLPNVIFRGCSLGALLTDFFRNMAHPDATFLIPALRLEATELWEITEGTAFLGSKPMSRARFLEVFRGLLVQVGVPVDTAQASTYNRLRRFLPTLANSMGLSPVDLQAIGNWTEIPEGGGGDPSVKKAKGNLVMGLHYSGGKLERSATVKLRCMARFMALFQQKLATVALTEDGLFPRDSWCWPEWAAMHRETAEMPAPPPELELGEEPGAPAIPEEEQVVLPEQQDEVDSLDSSSVSSTSSSASDISAEGVDLVGVLPDQTAVEDMGWLQQGKKIHLIREEAEGERPLPWCRDKPFVQEPQGRGRGFTQSAHSAFCQRCLARMPRGLYSALADHNGWLH